MKQQRRNQKKKKANKPTLFYFRKPDLLLYYTPNSNGEVIFRASTDGGATFGNKTNLSNTTNIDSVDAEIAAEGGNIMITWWERNQTANTPVARISTDNGETFGPTLNLATNGTIGEAEGEGEEGE